MHNKMKDKHLVFGASLKPERYSHKAVLALHQHGYEVLAIGGREGSIEEISIQTGHPELTEVHTVTMYMGASRQADHYEYLMSLNPERIIFNPGAENPELSKLANENGIITENACTLVLLNTGQYELSS